MIEIDGTQIQTVSGLKYLGQHLDQNLHFKEHEQGVTLKASKTANN